MDRYLVTESGGCRCTKHKIYSHIAFDSRRQFDNSRRSDGQTYSGSVMHSPPAVAFGDSYRPGFSTYPDTDILGDIYGALEAHGTPPWASAEGTNVDIHGWPSAHSR